ncbi:MAG: hypothetical protein QF486_04225 [Candidatus Woesearchaeota archaeon]|jgi:hypothetical protein|nr:hypothetical protein [Candidatus Woesearchaeota archaeon]MDP7181709.1 hypothetical protein [Candidatus Woesearchaeota archaeon]MDP7198798.1 hypothetical protein [Candidatus Woesearchaeota archaeon]MDP7467202.1 hypothetical protein [Candidatus Woesearchaeota archaeon]MDP7647463.1 hypothetical protein [Candidatus Woesearchaeota archaeon]|tara:strand:+ start:460 stop:801 length:342 start_codon:yes stop_codon:yes gene_type:complete
MIGSAVLRGSGDTPDLAEEALQQRYQKFCETDRREATPPMEGHLYLINGTALEARLNEGTPNRLRSFQLDGPEGFKNMLLTLNSLVGGLEGQKNYRLEFEIAADVPISENSSE